MRSVQSRLEDEFDDFLGHVVGEAEVGAGDRDEAEHDRRGLRDLAAVGPLYALELGPAGAQEADRAVAAAQRRAGLGARLAAAASAAAAAARPRGPEGPPGS